MSIIFPRQFNSIRFDFSEASYITEQNFCLIQKRLRATFPILLESADAATRVPGNFPLVAEDFALELCKLINTCKEIQLDFRSERDFKFDTNEPIPIWFFKFIAYIWEICEHLIELVHSEYNNIEYNKKHFSKNLYRKLLNTGGRLETYLSDFQTFLVPFRDSYYTKERIPIQDRQF